MKRDFTLPVILAFAAVVTIGGIIAVEREPKRVAAQLATGLEPASVAVLREHAELCGVYGLPGSPAVVVVEPGFDGTAAVARIESHIFGGSELEECILEGARGLPLGGPLRVELSTFEPGTAPVDEAPVAKDTTKDTRPIRRARRAPVDTPE
jgi:hypothetical protein